MEENIIQKQRDILFEAVKTIALNKQCPNWVRDILAKAVKEAKSYKPKEIKEEIKKEPLAPGDIVKNAEEPKDKCLYKISNYNAIIDGVQLFDVIVLKGTEKVPAGLMLHNVPCNKMIKVD